MITGIERETGLPPCVLYEDDDILVVNKPAGLNTHAPSAASGDGLFEWLRHGSRRWASLAIIHRLDKDTSGIMVFGKTPLANQSLTRQFTEHRVRKVYVAWTDRAVSFNEKRVQSHLARAGDRYVSRPNRTGDQAVTTFQVVAREDRFTVLEARPETGRTHQIRVHAFDLGCPLFGDVLYGGTSASRLHLHAQSISFQHPVSGQELNFTTPANFRSDRSLELRRALFSPLDTNAFRLLHGHADQVPGVYADQLGPVLMVETDGEPPPAAQSRIRDLAKQLGLDSVLHKTLRQQVRGLTKTTASPVPWIGSNHPSQWVIKENGLEFLLKGNEGYSIGLFLDQRENRRRILTWHIGAGAPVCESGPAASEVLNTFAYTCGFSVCAAMAGARTTSLDLSKKYLDWGRENFRLNQLDPNVHEFVYGDFFEWTKRWARKGRLFDVIILDPPTFSTSKQSGVLRVEKDYERLMRSVLPLVRSKGSVLACANTSRLEPEVFLNMVRQSVKQHGRSIQAEQWAPQPPDFPVTRLEPAHLKSIWLRLD
jgi:23S rRNA (cytosine1962-C5)-methyltransferase